MRRGFVAPALHAGAAPWPLLAVLVAVLAVLAGEMIAGFWCHQGDTGRRP